MIIEDELELGIMILAYIHAGSITINCGNCGDEMKKSLNCTNNDAENIVFTDEYLGDFTQCPLKWLTNAVYNWYDEYFYLMTFPGAAPSYENCNSRFWQCVKIYKSTLNRLEMDRSNKTSKPNTDSQNTFELSKLRSGFAQRKK